MSLNSSLSNREAEVLAKVASGMSNKEVGNDLFVTEKTVKFHLTNIYKKIGVKSRSEALVKVIRKTLDPDNQLLVSKFLEEPVVEQPKQEVPKPVESDTAGYLPAGV